MFDRKLSTNWINLSQDHERESDSQRTYAVLYCDLIESAKTDKKSNRRSCPLKIQGEYVSLTNQCLTKDILLKFLVHEVSEIIHLETRKCYGKMKFWAIFLTRSDKSEDFFV